MYCETTQAYYEKLLDEAFAARMQTAATILFVKHPALDAVQNFKESVIEAIAARDAVRQWIRDGMPVPPPTGWKWVTEVKGTAMAHKPTTWNHDPHAADGSLDYDKLEESLAHGKAMLVGGQEGLIDAYQQPLADGSVLTIYHHAPAGHPGGDAAIAKLKAHLAKQNAPAKK